MILVSVLVLVLGIGSAVGLVRMESGEADKTFPTPAASRRRRTSGRC